MTDCASTLQTDDIAATRHRYWTHDRTARLGFLMGLGWDANRIAKDPIIASPPNNIRRHAHRFGLAFREATAWHLSPDATRYFESAGAKRGLTCEGLIKLLLLEIASEPHLLDNILDDGF